MKRIAALDGLRGVAALAVVAFHTVVGGTLGSFGVEVFLVHSGWLNGTILLGGEDVRTFYRKRAFRILPLYYAVLLLLWLTERTHPNYTSALLLVPWVFGVVHENQGRLGLLVLWTIGVELHCYLILPWVIRQKRTLWLLVATALIARLACFIVARTGLWDPMTPTMVGYAATPCRWDGVALGALAASWQSDRPNVVRWFLKAWPWLLLARLIVVPFTDTGSGWLPQFVVPLGTVTALGLLFAGLDGRLDVPLAHEPFTWIGKRCLGIYLLHPFAMELMRHAPPWVPLFEGTLVLTLVMAAVSWTAFELPMQRLGARLGQYKSSRNLATPATTP